MILATVDSWVELYCPCYMADPKLAIFKVTAHLPSDLLDCAAALVRHQLEEHHQCNVRVRSVIVLDETPWGPSFRLSERMVAECPFGDLGLVFPVIQKDLAERIGKAA